MNTRFADIVEDIKPLSISEKEVLLDLIRKFLIDERRDEIFESSLGSMAEYNDGKLEFSEDLAQLKGML